MPKLDLKALEEKLEGLTPAKIDAYAKKNVPELVKEADEAWDELTKEQKIAAIVARVAKDNEPQDVASESLGSYSLGAESKSAVDVLDPQGQRVRTYDSANHGSHFKELAEEFVAKMNSKR